MNSNTAAVALKTTEKKRIKKMGTIQVNPVEVASEQNVGLYKGNVSKTVDDAFSGKEVKKSATYELPIAQSVEDAMAFVKNSEADLLFWFNFGRRIAARNQVTASLTQVFADEKINDLYKGYKNALDSMLQGSKDEKKIARYREFILGEDQYVSLREALASLGTDAEDKPHFNFGEIELKKPSNTPGRKKKESGEESESED